MPFFRNIWNALTGLGRNAGVQSAQPGYYFAPSATPVTQDTALQLSGVWACVRLLAESVASLPLIVYQKNPGGDRTQIYNHPLQALFEGQVNRWQTRFEFFEAMTMNLALNGNAYALKQSNSSGDLIGLVPLMACQVTVSLEIGGDVQYKYVADGKTHYYSSSQIWHVKLMGTGIVGLSPLAYARNSLGLAQAAENRTTKIFSNGAKPAGILMLDQLLKPDQREEIRRNFNQLSEGNEERLHLLEANMKYQQVSMTPQDIELLSSRRFQLEDIARFFGVPSVLINDTAATTVWGSGIYQIVQGFYKLGLRPYLSRYESSIISQLIPLEGRSKYEFKFDFTSLIRPDAAERFKSYKEAIQGGLMTPNQARQLEGWPPVEGGEHLYMQQQMVPLHTLNLEADSG